MYSSLRGNCHTAINLSILFNSINSHAKNRRKNLIRCFQISSVREEQNPKPKKPQKKVNIFDRNAKLLQRERATFNDRVELYDLLKDEVGYRVADRIFDIKRKFKTVINMGCGRGYVAKHVCSDSVENLIMTDNSELLLSQSVCNDPNVKVQKIVCDEENLDKVFKPETADMVITSLALHWVNDLPACFQQVKDILTIDGVFLGSIFGMDTLQELRSSLQLAESERKGGVSPHVSPFTKPMDIGYLLSSSGFTMQTLDVDEIVVRYSDMFHLLEHIKGMGESNAAWNRPLHISRDILLAASVIYEQLYANTKLVEGEDNSGVPATYQIVYFIGWKPDPSKPQPEPKDPAMASLRNYYDIHKLSVDGIKEIKVDE